MEFTIWIVFMVIMDVIHTLVGALGVSDPMWRIGLSFYGQICANVLCIFAFRKYLCNPREVRLFSKKYLKYYMWAVVIGIGVCLGHRIFFLSFMGFVEQSVQDIGKTVIVDQTMFLSTALGVLYEILLGPITEEFIFRGIIFPVARQKRGNLYAIIISSILFALTHFNGVQFITALFMGVVIGYAVILTDNIYIGVVIHVVNNSFSFINVNFLNKFWELSYSQMLMQVFGGCILLLFSILMLRRESGKELLLER